MQEIIDNKKIEEAMDNTVKIFERMTYGEPKNFNTLQEIPNPIMRLYKIDGTYFDDKEELEKFCKENNKDINNVVIVDYLGTVAGRKDVISTFYKNRMMLYTACDRDGYGMYNHERSFYCGKFIWEYHYGSIRDIYNLFKERGVILEEDIYGKIDKSNEELFKKMKELHLFNY
mgnify:CR=1 FL=1